MFWERDNIYILLSIFRIMKIEDLAKFWARLVGNTIAQEAYYTEVFMNLFKFGQFYNEDIKGWSKKSMEYWRGRLHKFEIIQLKREKFGGKVYYVISPMFFATVDKTRNVIRKVI